MLNLGDLPLLQGDASWGGAACPSRSEGWGGRRTGRDTLRARCTVRPTSPSSTACRPGTSRRTADHLRRGSASPPTPSRGGSAFGL